jgi:hypothetical protein
MTDEKRGRGRPKMAPGEARDVIFSIRLSMAERSLLEAAAQRAGIDSASDWARDILLGAVETHD